MYEQTIGYTFIMIKKKTVSFDISSETFYPSNKILVDETAIKWPFEVEIKVRIMNTDKAQ